MSSESGGIHQIAQMMGQMKMNKEQRAQWENIQEEMMGLFRPELEHRRKVYWPVETAVGSEVTRRATADPSTYFTAEEPLLARAKTRVGRIFKGKERDISRLYGRAGKARMLPAAKTQLMLEEARTISDLLADISAREAERISGEKSVRMTEALNFIAAKGGSPAMPSAGGFPTGSLNFGSVAGGMAMDAETIAGLIYRIQQIRNSRYQTADTKQEAAN